MYIDKAKQIMDMETETKVVRLEAELSEARDELKEAKREVGELKARVAVIEVAMSQVISAMGNLEADVIPSMNKTLRNIRGSLSAPTACPPISRAWRAKPGGVPGGRSRTWT